MAIKTVTGGGDELQTAINGASANDTLLIDDGIYSGVIINKNLTLSSINGPDNCIIDGQKQKRCITNAHTTYWSGYQINIYGLTLQNGYVISGDGQVVASNGAGGGDRIYKAYDCKILSCSCDTGSGGGIYMLNNSNSIISNCYFEHCYAKNYGGSANGAGKIYNSYFKNSNCGGWGGAIMDARGIYNCIFDHCGTGTTYVIHANNGAGSIVKNCIFKDCYAPSNSLNYGLIADYQAINCLIYGTMYGTALRDSGDMFNCTCLNNTFTSNRAVYIRRSASYQSTNGTFICNNIFDGSGVYIQGTGSKTVHVCNNLVGTTIGHATNLSNYIEENNISGNAQFKDKTENNAHLIRTSEVLSGGDITYCRSSEDLEGKYWKDPPSVGCYQYTAEKQNIPNDLYPMGRNKEIHAYDAEIEYIESTGTQYIDTGIIPSSGIAISMRFAVTNRPSTDRALFGGYNPWTEQFVFFIKPSGTAGSYFTIADGQPRWAINNAAWPVIDKWYDFSYENNTTVCDGVTATNMQSSAITTSRTCWIFCRNNNLNNASYMKLARFTMKQNGIIVRDFIPVRVGTVGYLYDRITNNLFGNLGTGNFILGKDI